MESSRQGDEGVAADRVVVDELDLVRVIVEGADLGLPQSVWPSLQAQQQKNQVPNHNGSRGYYVFLMQRDDVIIFKEMSESFISLPCDHLGLFEFNYFINEYASLWDELFQRCMKICILFKHIRG